jgi:BirA family biotin operon repressor/biotin-[acetyl-CoA-carboxylase] ligase
MRPLDNFGYNLQFTRVPVVMKPLTVPLLRAIADGRFHSGALLAKRFGVSRAGIWHAVEDAETAGVQVFRVRGRGYRLADPLEFIDAAAVLQQLGPDGKGLRLEVLDAVESTNSYLFARAQDPAAHGQVVIAEMQTAGRGRRGRAWHTPLAGALTFSLLWRFQQGVAALGGLSLAVGLAVAQGCEALAIEGIQLKWPNDVMHGGRKLAGILIEVQGEMQGPSVAVIGVGLNYRLTAAVLENIDQGTADIAAITALLPSRNQLFAEVLRRLAVDLRLFETRGFTPLIADWEKRHCFQHKPVRLTFPDGSGVSGVAEGVAADGSITLATSAGRRRFSVGEISLRAPTAAAIGGERGFL